MPGHDGKWLVSSTVIARSEAPKQSIFLPRDGLLRCARNDGLNAFNSSSSRAPLSRSPPPCGEGLGKGVHTGSPDAATPLPNKGGGSVNSTPHCEEQSDEASQSFAALWIASLRSQ